TTTPLAPASTWWNLPPMGPKRKSRLARTRSPTCIIYFPSDLSWNQAEVFGVDPRLGDVGLDVIHGPVQAALRHRRLGDQVLSPTEVPQGAPDAANVEAGATIEAANQAGHLRAKEAPVEAIDPRARQDELLIGRDAIEDGADRL